MPCPECGADDRLCVKNGPIFRRNAIDPETRTRGCKIQRYLCTKCAYTGRGNKFGLSEEFNEGEKEEESG